LQGIFPGIFDNLYYSLGFARFGLHDEH
jgi:hypothetical protein